MAIALCAALAVPSKAAIPGSESSAMTQQQNDIVKGIVVDENGETVIGASVLIKGTVSGTVTGMDGRFEIRAAKGRNIKELYRGKVVAVDVDAKLNYEAGRGRAVILEGDRAYVVKDSGKRRRLR